MRYVGHPLPPVGPAGLGLEESRVGLKTTESTFRAGTPKLLFEGTFRTTNNSRANYDVTPDGQRFVMTTVSDQPQNALTQINVVLNWFEELKQRVPVQ